MKRLITCFIVIAISCSSCAYSNIQIPMDKDFNHTDLGDKQGQSDTHSVLYLVSWGDSGTKAAAEDGDIKTINHADRKILSVLFGLYTRISTVVYGE